MDLSQYYEDICKKQPIISREEEEALFKVAKDTSGVYTAREKSKARDIILTSNLRFVFQKAKSRSRAVGTSDAFEELIAAGNEGLLKAFDKYTPGMDVRFLTYAGWWVMQTQLKELSRIRIVSLPIWKQQLAALIAKEQASRDNLLTDEELREAFPQHKLPILKELSETKYLTYYIDDMLEEGGSFESIYASYDHILEDDLQHLCEQLPSPYNKVIDMVFGLTEGTQASCAEIARTLKISRDDVRKLKKEGLQKLRLKILTPSEFVASFA